MERPCVSTTAGALPEVVGDAGILVPPADPVALANAIARLMDNPQLRSQYSELGRKRILENFNWKDAAKHTLDVYREAIESKRVKEIRK